MFAAESRAEPVPAAGALNLESPQTWKQIVEPMEPFLDAVAQRLAKQIHEFDPAIVPYAEYALTGNGKQLRPILVALSAGATGRVNDTHTTVAVIIEMVHLATLVHDDVMDEAELRRGRLTLAANWGNQIAVLFGDCLFAQALRLAAGFPTPEICRAVAAATNTVCAGEILQTRNRHNFHFTEAEYFKVLEMKTAELFALSCDLGSCLSGANGASRKALREFGLAMGTAYQVYDDCLDVFGSESAAGKSLGTDLATGKLTLPVLLLRDRLEGADRAKLEKMIQRWSPQGFPVMREWLARYEMRAASLEMIERYLARAREALRHVPGSASRSGLIGLTEFLTRQALALGAAA